MSFILCELNLDKAVTENQLKKRKPVLKEFLPSSEWSHFRRLFAKFPFSNTWFWQDLIFGTLSNGKQLGWKSLANLGDKCQERTGQGCQDAVWARLRAKTPPPSGVQGAGTRFHIPKDHLSPQMPGSQGHGQSPESLTSQQQGSPGLPDPTHPMPFTDLM